MGVHKKIGDFVAKVSINSPSGEGGGSGLNFVFAQLIPTVSINSPSGEGGGTTPLLGSC